ncbi:MAG: S-adenosylmethionine:tRNA ribosyltransferase-isomerase [Acidimicrobiia bacterium]|nr:S-adenosylmethionine:tRNA ribosyltransferase-isomerase [Acidimicrobiia bacterium]
MIAAHLPDRKSGRLLAVDADGGIQHLCRADLSTLFRSGDLVVANDAATLPASLHGQHRPTGEPVEIRLAAFVTAGDPTRFLAIAFGAGDYHTLTENRAKPPMLSPGDHLLLGPLVAVVESVLDHPRLLKLRFQGESSEILAGLAQHGRPIQYAHVPAPLPLWDVWTSLAAEPFAFEAPSAGFALDWQTLTTWQRRGIELATLTHAAGISSTGDTDLDARLPFDEPYIIPGNTAAAIRRTRARGGRVIAIGTTVVRALEAAATTHGTVHPGNGVARGRIGPETRLRVTDTILTGMHEPGESHFELLRAFTDDPVLHSVHQTAVERRYRTHEFGDSLLIERRNAA